MKKVVCLLHTLSFKIVHLWNLVSIREYVVAFSFVAYRIESCIKMLIAQCSHKNNLSLSLSLKGKCAIFKTTKFISPVDHKNQPKKGFLKLCSSWNQPSKKRVPLPSLQDFQLVIHSSVCVCVFAFFLIWGLTKWVLSIRIS